VPCLKLDQHSDHERPSHPRGQPPARRPTSYSNQQKDPRGLFAGRGTRPPREREPEIHQHLLLLVEPATATPLPLRALALTAHLLLPAAIAQSVRHSLSELVLPVAVAPVPALAGLGALVPDSFGLCPAPFAALPHFVAAGLLPPAAVVPLFTPGAPPSGHLVLHVC